MAVVVLLASGGLWLAFSHYNGQINRLSGVFNIGERPAEAPKNAQNLLLVGSDSREGSNAKGTQSKGAKFITGQRADTIILVHLFGKTDKAQLVSIPRDSYVEIPAYSSPKTGRQQPAQFAKLNKSFALGGAPLLIQTIEKLTSIKIDHYLQVDFTGFKTMVDKLGGVDICLTQPAKEKLSRIDLPAGRHHVNGEVALSFVRQRYELANGDVDRIARQQQVVGSLANKVLSSGTLLDPFKLTGVLDVATASLQVDEKFTGKTLKDLALRMRGFSSDGVLFTTVPIADISARRAGASVVLLDDLKAADMFGALRRDDPPTTKKPGKASPVTVAPSKVVVRVFNGSGVQGQGRKAAADLSGVGFQVSGIPTNRGDGAPQTTILFGPTRAESARTLQAAIPGSVLQPDDNLGRTLELVVGSNYAGAQKVTVTSGKPSTSAPTVRTAKDKGCTR